MKRRYCGRGHSSGQALVEFALVLPILMVLLMGIIELGRAWHMRQVLTDAAREGARLAVVADPVLATSAATKLAVLGRVDSVLSGAGIDPGQVSVGFPTAFDSLKTGSGQTISIRVAYPFQFAVLHVLANVLQLDSLRTTVTMRNE
jgi:Flp pilus assembly protein TadG